MLHCYFLSADLLFRKSKNSRAWAIFSHFLLPIAVLLSAALPSGAQSNSCTTPNFAPASNYPVGFNPQSIVTGDFNKDGVLDLATANRASDDVSVLLGNSFGGFTGGGNFVVGDRPQSVRTGDFNGDGNLDLVTANLSSGNVSVLFGNGSGGFATASNFAVGAFPRFAATCDFNGDGNADLAVTRAGNIVSVFLGNGSGGFTAVGDFAAGEAPNFIATDDFNEDGNLDLATVSSTGYIVSVLLGNGSGGFSTASNYGVGVFPTSIATGDFNKDGNVDMAVSNGFGNSVSVLLGNGSGGFGATSNYAVGAFPSSVATSDFNGDGILDLATANTSSNNASVLLGDGNGGFTRGGDFAVGNFPRSVATGDFNKDGKVDLAVANEVSNNVSVLLNTCTAVIDSDNDGVNDDVDNCPNTANPNQENTDGDAQGDVCDTDDDNDGVSDVDEISCGSNPLNANSTCEVCDGVDNDVDSQVDEGFANTDGDSQADCVDPDDDNDGVSDALDCAPLDPNNALVPIDYYPDNDGDGFGDPNGTPIPSCRPLPGYVPNNQDCDDTKVLYQDSDNDGFGSNSKVACGGVENNEDCDDTKTTYTDADGDGFGAGARTACGVENNLDCNDNSNQVKPGATEVCGNGVDDNCNGQVDEGCLKVSTFTLYNATSDQSLGTMSNNQVIDLATISGKSINIVANTTPAKVGSVRLLLSGKRSHNQTENLAAYALFGNNSNDYNKWTPQVGSYTLTATPYSASNAGGTAGTPLTINFTVVGNTPRLSSFTLVNSSTDKDIKTLKNGDVIDLAQTPNINIRANPAQNVSCVRFALNSNPNYRTENATPYAIAGDNSGNYNRWNIQPGIYTIKATPYSRDNASGVVGSPVTVTITIKNTAASSIMVGVPQAGLTEVDAEAPLHLQVWPNPVVGQGRVFFRVPVSNQSRLVVVDVMGREVAQLFSGLAEGGMLYQKEIHAHRLAKGVYFVRLVIQDGKTATQKIVVQ